LLILETFPNDSQTARNEKRNYVTQGTLQAVTLIQFLYI